MNKKYLQYFAVTLFVLLIITPGIVSAYKCANKYTNVTVSEAKKMTESEDVFILDVRTPAEYNLGHIEGATLITLRNVPKLDPDNLPDEQLLPARMKELPHNKRTKILVYCKLGGRSAEASDLLVKAGYKRVYNMDNDEDSKNTNGGIVQWVTEGYPIVATYDSWKTEWYNYLPKS